MTSSVEIEQSEQTALIYFDDGVEHLFLSAGAKPTGELSDLGWVIPVPNVPGDYGTAAPELFTQLGEWMNLRHVRTAPKTRSMGGGTRSARDNETRSLEVMPTVETGPYEITPLKARGKAGLKALKRWLKEHGLQVPESTEPARYYVERKWTFLAVQVSPSAGSETLDLDGNLRPLYVSFETNRAVYPLKFETNQGEFSVTIHLVTNRRIPDEAFGDIQSKGFWVAGYEGTGRPTVVAPSDGTSGRDDAGVSAEDTGSSDSGDESGPVGTPDGKTIEETLLEGLNDSNDSGEERELTQTLEDPPGEDQIPKGSILHELSGRGSGPEGVPGNCLKPPGTSSRPHYVVDRGIVEKDRAPDALVNALDDVGAWEDRRELAIRTIHAPTFNAERAEPDGWDEDFAVPTAQSARTLTALMRLAESESKEGETSEAQGTSDISSVFRKDRKPSNAAGTSTDAGDSSENSKPTSSAPDERNDYWIWIPVLVAAVLAALVGWRLFAGVDH